MFQVFDVVMRSHEPRLVLVALCVCSLACLVTFHFLARAWDQRDKPNLSIWLGLTTLVAGSGIWATHFIAMSAFEPVAQIGFRVSDTIISFLIAVCLAGSAFLIMVATPRPFVRIIAGTVLGVATSLMHYVGANGMVVAGSVTWDAELIVASVFMAIGLSIASLAVAGRCRTVGQRAGGAILFALSIAALHFTGMTAVTITPDPSVALPPGLLSGTWIAYSVAGVTCIILICALAVWLVDHRARRDSDQRMSFLARHDLLTSLPNRLLFQELVSQDLASTALGRSGAVLCLDLDGFKEVNDIFGHAAGDALLVEVANRLRASVGEHCIAARLGGDEFAVFATGLDASITAAATANTLLEVLARPYTIDGNRVDVGCSIGVALTPGDGTDYQALLIRADVALSRAKADGRGVVRFFEAEMDERMRERRRLAQDLRHALAAGQLRLVYQPQLDLDTNVVSGFEVLMRWDHPTDGAISPATFIPIAEETGLILRIGEWALREACREAATWPPELSVAVNVSIAQFRQADLDVLIESVLAETGLDPQRLEIEVTESLFFDSVPRTLTVLASIKKLGVRVSMDDFGTGYSSLSTLQSFPFDKIKIDRSFTAQIGNADKGTAIVKAIVGLGDSLEMRVVAEGVETGEQLAFLREQNCSAMQGFVYGRPKPIEEYHALIAAVRNSGSAANKVVLLKSA